MARVSDVRGKPGDFVMPRGGQPIGVWSDVQLEGRKPLLVSSIKPKAIGMIVATHATGWTYVLWSNPTAVGWSRDGELRTLTK